MCNTGRLDKFVNNTGVCVADYSPPTLESAADGIFQDKILGNVVVTLSDLKDGASNTLMLSENLDAYYYNDSPIIILPNNYGPADVEKAVNCSERGTGFVWWDTSISGNLQSPLSGSPAPYPVAAINGQKGDFDPGPVGRPTAGDMNTPTANANTNFAARPSSSHPGLVMVVFADGKARPLREDIDYAVYSLLMTPRGEKGDRPRIQVGKRIRCWMKDRSND